MEYGVNHFGVNPHLKVTFEGLTIEGANHSGAGSVIIYSDVEGGRTGTGNLDADPRFVDAANGNYRLGVGSSCTDRGTSVGVPARDIEGRPRDAVPDMGTYEWVGFRVFPPLTFRSQEP